MRALLRIIVHQVEWDAVMQVAVPPKRELVDYWLRYKCGVNQSLESLVSKRQWWRALGQLNRKHTPVRTPSKVRAETVTRVLELRAAGRNYRAISRQLRAERLRVSIATVGRIVSNPDRYRAESRQDELAEQLAEAELLAAERLCAGLVGPRFTTGIGYLTPQ
jgi:hypothetical protein